MDISRLVADKNAFEDQTFQYLINSFSVYEKKDYVGSSVWASVFIESFLKKLIFYFSKELKVEGLEKTTSLSRLLGQLKTIVEDNEVKMDPDDRRRYQGIMTRCQEIRSKRNRMVHDEEVIIGDEIYDAHSIHHSVESIVSIYLRTGAASWMREYHEKELFGEGKKVSDFKIFISTITPHTARQEVFIHELKEEIRKIGALPVMCEFSSYDSKDPLGKVKSVMEDCHAVIVVGLERSHSYLCKDKEGSASEKEYVHRKYSSSWLQMESGLAFGLGKKLFVLCQKDVVSDGIFDRSWNSVHCVDLPIPLSVKDKSVTDTLKEIQKYMEEERFV